jgi:hypothetical protein
LAEMNLEELVVEASSGSSRALEELVLRIQDQVFALSLRMLYHPSDAEDASQEILIKVITNLHGFRFEGPFRGWVMRIAANHLKATRKRASEQKGLDLERAQARLDKADARGWFVRPLEAPEPLAGGGDAGGLHAGAHAVPGPGAPPGFYPGHGDGYRQPGGGLCNGHYPGRLPQAPFQGPRQDPGLSQGQLRSV